MNMTHPEILQAERTGYGFQQFSDTRERDILRIANELHRSGWDEDRPTFLARVMAGTHSPDYEDSLMDFAKRVYNFRNN